MKPLIYILILLSTIPLNAQINSVRMYAFGHSLIDHATSSNETNIMYWINDISQVASNTFATTGQYGFLPTHANLPPSSNWGYSGVTSSWDSSLEPFSDADINTILITAANFIQHENPDAQHPLDANTSVIQATETIFDWVNTQESNVRYYIYGNWPEMDLANAFPPTPPTQTEIDFFHNQTIGSFTDWWINYQDLMLVSRPSLNTRLIPVGAIISKILRDIIPNQIAFADLYEDSAPHGRASIYFLAGMITYMAVYEQNIPDTYVPNSSVHSVIINNLSNIKDFSWDELNSFNLPNGDSRVFYSNILNVEDENFDNGSVMLYPNPTLNQFKILNLDGYYNISIYDTFGRIIQVNKNINSNIVISLENLENGIYFISIENMERDKVFSRKLVVNR